VRRREWISRVDLEDFIESVSHACTYCLRLDEREWVIRVEDLEEFIKKDDHE